MSKLHIYRKIGKTWVKYAGADGTVDHTNPFTAIVTSGSVTAGNAYEIRQGMSATGSLFACTAVTGAMATFMASG